MTERDALYQSILDSPEDNVFKLVFADWLEEHGEVNRTEFIRTQTYRWDEYYSQRGKSPYRISLYSFASLPPIELSGIGR